MAKLILKMHISLDGFVADPTGKTPWMFGFEEDEEALQWELQNLWNAQAHLMGSRTFKDMKGYWPTSKEAEAEPMNAIPKIAFSRRELETGGTTAAEAGSWDAPEVLGGDLKEEIERLKERPGKPLLVHGGATFARSLVAIGTVDELRLTVCPVALGTGASIFDVASAPHKLEQVTIIRFPLGFVGQVFRPA